MARLRTKGELEEIIKLVSSRKRSDAHKLDAIRRAQNKPYEVGSAEAATLFFQAKSDPIMDEILLSYITIFNDESNLVITDIRDTIGSKDSWADKARKLDSMLSSIDATSISRSEHAYLHDVQNRFMRAKAAKKRSNKELRQALEQRFADIDFYATNNFQKPETPYDELAEVIRDSSRSNNILRDLTKAYSKVGSDDLINNSILEAGKVALSWQPWNERLFMVEDALAGVQDDGLNEHEANYLAHIAGHLRKNKAISENIFLRPRRDRIVGKIAELLGDEYAEYSNKAKRLYALKEEISELASMDFPYSVHEEMQSLMISYDSLKSELLSTAPFFYHKEIEKTCREIERDREKINADFRQAYREYQVELDSLNAVQEAFDALTGSESGVRAMELAETLLPSYDLIKRRVLARAPVEEMGRVERICRSIDNDFSRILAMELEDRQSYNKNLDNLAVLDKRFSQLSLRKGGSGAYEEARGLVKVYRQTKEHVLTKAPYSDAERAEGMCDAIEKNLDEIILKERTYQDEKAEKERKDATAKLCRLHRRFTQLRSMDGGEGASEEAQLLIDSSYIQLKERSLLNAPEETGRKIDLLCSSIEKNYDEIVEKETEYKTDMFEREKESLRIDPNVFLTSERPLEDHIPISAMRDGLDGIDMDYIDDKIGLLGRIAKGLSTTMASLLVLFILASPNKGGDAASPANREEIMTPAQVAYELDSFVEQQTGQTIDPVMVAQLEKERKQREKKEFLEQMVNRTRFANIELNEEYLPDENSLDELTALYTKKMHEKFPNKTAYLDGTELPVRYKKVNGNIVPFILRDGLTVTSQYGLRINPFISMSNRQDCLEGKDKVEQNGKNMICDVFHWGTDLVYSESPDLYAVTPGVVTSISFNSKIGYSVEYVSHLSDGSKLLFKYLHMKEAPKHLREGDRVSPFDTEPIGQYGGDWSGTTGEHLHIEMRIRDRNGIARWVNPAHYLPINEGIALAEYIQNRETAPGEGGIRVAQNKKGKEGVGSSKIEYMEGEDEEEY